jgi:hypothetical protein
MSDVDQASSKYWQTSTQASGVFSRSENNSFAAANMVYVRYCSSDAWMGNAVAWEEQFRGAPTVYAVFTDLLNNMGLAAGAKLLFGGCSAGARGAMVHLDNVVAMLAQEGIEARGMLDSGLWIDVQPVTNTGMGGTLLDQAEYVYGFANTSSVIPADCAAAYPGQEYKCLFGQYRMPFVKSDYFISMSQCACACALALALAHMMRFCTGSRNYMCACARSRRFPDQLRLQHEPGDRHAADAEQVHGEHVRHAEDGGVLQRLPARHARRAAEPAHRQPDLVRPLQQHLLRALHLGRRGLLEHHGERAVHGVAHGRLVVWAQHAHHGVGLHGLRVHGAVHPGGAEVPAGLRSHGEHRALMRVMRA